MSVRIINIPGILLYYFIMAAWILPEIHGVRVVFGLPAQFMEGGLDGVVFGKWLLVTGTPILANGIILERGRQIELFSRLRMKRRNSFQIKMTVACAMSGAIWVIVLAAFVMWVEGGRIALQMILIAMPNILMWELLQIMIYYCFKNAFWSGAAILLLNGGSCLAGLHMESVFPYMPAAWGMLCRSSLWRERADLCIRYEYMMAANIAAAVICLMIIMKNKGEERYGCDSY